MQVSFIIPLYNCLALTQQMVASLQATLPRDLAHEIFLVDDGSTDGTRDWLESLRPPFRVVLNERNLGYAAANNRAVALARGEFLVLLNNDLVLLPGWLEPMLAAHRLLGLRAGIVGNVQHDARSNAIDHAGIVFNVRAKPEHARALPAEAPGLTGIALVPAVTGACLLLSRGLWQELGGFDEAFVNGGEDMDLCFRARAAGREIAVALQSRVRHHISSSSNRKLHDERNSFRLAERWQREFIHTAIPYWVSTYLRAACADPRADEAALTLHALAYSARWTTVPPPHAQRALEASLAHEFARWRRLLSMPSASAGSSDSNASTTFALARTAASSTPPPPLTAARAQIAWVI